jgi:hypothetical protein
MKVAMKLGIAGLLIAMGLPIQAQQMNKDPISPNYKESCLKEQVQLHAKLKDVAADMFNDFCDCMSRQLASKLSATQIKELNQSKTRPTWLKVAEQAAGKACLKEGPSTQV